MFEFFFQISTEPAPRSDVIFLQKQLNSRMKLRQARETGICPIRRELFSQAFGMNCIYV